MSDMCRERARNLCPCTVPSSGHGVFRTSEPYGDGVFALPRRRPMTFQQCVSYHLVREELAYNVPVDAPHSVARWQQGSGAESADDGAAGVFMRRHYKDLIRPK